MYFYCLPIKRASWISICIIVVLYIRKLFYRFNISVIYPHKTSELDFYLVGSMTSVSRRVFCQYFYCLPHKTSESDFHLVGQMISASRRIFYVFIYAKTNLCCYLTYLGALTPSQRHNKVKCFDLWYSSFFGNTPQTAPNEKVVDHKTVEFAL